MSLVMSDLGDKTLRVAKVYKELLSDNEKDKVFLSEYNKEMKDNAKSEGKEYTDLSIDQYNQNVVNESIDYSKNKDFIIITSLSELKIDIVYKGLTTFSAKIKSIEDKYNHKLITMTNDDKLIVI